MMENGIINISAAELLSLCSVARKSTEDIRKACKEIDEISFASGERDARFDEAKQMLDDYFELILSYCSAAETVGNLCNNCENDICDVFHSVLNGSVNNEL